MKLLELVMKKFPGASRASAKQWLRAGRVSVEGKIVKVATTEVPEKAHLSLSPRAAAQPVGAAARALRVIHEDGALIALDKPPGLLTVPTKLLRGSDSLQERLIKYLRGKGQQALVVHRLDRKTSGLVIFAKSEQAREKLKNQFAERTVVRKYITRVLGRVTQPHGELRHWLLEGEDLMVRIVDPPRPQKGPRVEGRGPRGEERWDSRQPPSRRAPPPRDDDDDEYGDSAPAPSHRRRGPGPGDDTPQPKEAITRYRVLRHEETTTVLEISIKTGRRAQIRVQLASIGHPIVGDHMYGRDAKATDRMHLHAAGLEFVHPTTGQPVKLATAEAPFLNPATGMRPREVRAPRAHNRRGMRAPRPAARPAPRRRKPTSR